MALVCAALLLRMVLPGARQQRWDRFWRRQAERLRGAGRWLLRQVRLLRSRGDARRAAERAIEQARGKQHDVRRDGNVIRPRRFERDDTDDDPKPPTLH